jgi:predicted PurR-regulated permease PerM
MRMERRIEYMAGIAAVILLIIGCVMILRPFIASLAWAGILCFTTWPIYQWIARRLNERRTLAASIMTLIIILVIIGPFSAVAYSLAGNVRTMFQEIKSGELQDPPTWVGAIPIIGEWIRGQWLELAHDKEKLEAAIKIGFGKSQNWLVHRGMDIGQGLMHLGLSVFISFFFYRDGIAVVTSLNRTAKRILGHRTQHILTVVGDTIKSVVYGVLGTAIAQGTLAGFGFWLAGAPLPFLLGLLTFFLSLVPAGPPFVWLPVTIWLFFKGSVPWGVFMAIWGMFVISGVDNIIKPYLISRGSKLPFVLVFLGVLGGIFAFGLIGVFLGPAFLAVGYTLLHEWSSFEQDPHA